MNYFRKRRIANVVTTSLVVVVSWVFLNRQEQSLGRSSFAGGYLLISGVLLLASFNLRKKLPYLHLGSASTWLQLHIYTSFVVIGLFVMHVGWRAPTGALETVLYMLFVGTSASGVYGLVITRRLPKKISKLREEVIYERIPMLRRDVARRAHAVVTELLESVEAQALVDYYSENLIPYFAGSRGFVYYLRPTSRMRNEFHADLSTLIRYESPAEHEAQARLRLLIDKRDDLDYHEAQQRKLKLWLFVHIAMTYGLVLCALFHGILVHAFVGAVQ